MNRVSSAKFYFELIIIFTVLTLTNDDYFISKKTKQTNKIQITTATMTHLFKRDKLGNGNKLLKVLKSSDMDKRNSKQNFLFYKLVS